MRSAAKHQKWIDLRAISYDPAQGGYGRSAVRGHVGAPSQQELLDLEHIHAAAAEKAEAEDRFADAAKEWDLAAALASQYAREAGNVEQEKAHQRFKEYRRRQALAQSSAISKGTGKLGTALLVASGAGLLYFLAPGLAVGAAAAIWSGTKRAGSYVTQKVKGD